MFTLNQSHHSALQRRAPRPPLMTRILCVLSLQRQRNQLADLDVAMLEDIGITRAQAQAESARSCWDAPEHWQG